MIDGTACDTENRVDPDVSGKRTKTRKSNPFLHSSLPIPPVPVTSLIQQGGNETQPMETVKSINGWKDDSMFDRSYGLDDPFSLVPFTAPQTTHQGEVSQDGVVDDNKDLPVGYWQSNTDDSINSVNETIGSSSLDPVKTFQEGIKGLQKELQFLMK